MVSSFPSLFPSAADRSLLSFAQINEYLHGGLSYPRSRRNIRPHLFLLVPQLSGPVNEVLFLLAIFIVATLLSDIFLY
jgi:hypothetical protein